MILLNVVLQHVRAEWLFMRVQGAKEKFTPMFSKMSILPLKTPLVCTSDAETESPSAENLQLKNVVSFTLR